MNKAEFVDALAEHFGGNRAEATRALNAVLQTIIYKTATEGRVNILGFGTFEKVLRSARSVQDPGTGKKIRIKALATPGFRPGAEFKAYVAGVKKVPRRRRTPPTRLTAAPQTAPLFEAPQDDEPQTQKRLAKKAAEKTVSAAPQPASRSARTDPASQRQD